LNAFRNKVGSTCQAVEHMQEPGRPGDAHLVIVAEAFYVLEGPFR
jgi:hypothetical protein